MEFRTQNYQRDHDGGRGQGKPLCHHIHSKAGGVQNEKEKMTEKPQIMKPNSTTRCMHKTPTDFSVLDEGR